VTSGIGPAPSEQHRGRALGIKAVSELLGVPAPTIRSWERRYALLTADRSAGGHRLYRDGDLAVLRRMRDEVAGGRAAVDAAAIATAGVAGTAEGLRDAVLSYAGRLDGRAIITTLDRGRDLLGLERAVDDVLLPAMREIGRLWSVGLRDVASAAGCSQRALRPPRCSSPPSRPRRPQRSSSPTWRAADLRPWRRSGGWPRRRPGSTTPGPPSSTSVRGSVCRAPTSATACPVAPTTSWRPSPADVAPSASQQS
jgi:hypothetical protein